MKRGRPQPEVSSLAFGDLERGIRELIRDVAREEVRRAIADAKQPDEYLSTRAAGAVAGVADATIRRWVRERRLPEHRAGRCVRVKRADVERLLARGRRHDTDDGELTIEEMAERDFGPNRARKGKRDAR